MPVTADHVAEYRTEGYTLIRGLIPAELTDRVRRRILEVAGDPKVWPLNRFQTVDPSRYRHDDGQQIPQGVQLPAAQEPLFGEMADHPALQEAMSGLLGGPVRRFTDQIGIRWGRIREEQGGKSFYHQDSYYWRIEPQLGCNAWIPLVPVNARTGGGLAVMPGTHADWTLLDHEQYYDDPPMGHGVGENWKPFQRHRIPLDQIDMTREKAFDMQPGDALFFTNFTWHRSDPNRSGTDQAYYAIAYRLQEAPSEGATGAGA